MRESRSTYPHIYQLSGSEKKSSGKQRKPHKKIQLIIMPSGKKIIKSILILTGNHSDADVVALFDACSG